MPVVLRSCNTGSVPNGLGQQLANILKENVIASTRFAFFNPDIGYVGTYQMNKDNSPVTSARGTDKTFFPIEKKDQ